MKLVVTEWPEHQLGFADFDYVARREFHRRVDQLIVEIDKARSFARQNPGGAALGIVSDRRVLLARYCFVAGDRDIHRGGAPDEVLFAVNPEVAALVGPFDAYQPSDHGT